MSGSDARLAEAIRPLVQGPPPGEFWGDVVPLIAAAVAPLVDEARSEGYAAAVADAQHAIKAMRDEDRAADHGTYNGTDVQAGAAADALDDALDELARLGKADA